MKIIKNATIKYTNLGVEHTDHGILSFTIGLDYGGGGQGFGQIVLDGVSLERFGKRQPTILAASLLLAIHEVFQCDWEQLPNKSCRACTNGEWGSIIALGHFLEDKWLWLKASKTEDSYEFVVTRFDEIEVSE